jgi:hypothetical protein
MANYDVIQDPTSPFPVHEENLLMKHYPQKQQSASSTSQSVRPSQNRPVMPAAVHTLSLPADQVDGPKLILTSNTTTELILTTQAPVASQMSVPGPTAVQDKLTITIPQTTATTKSINYYKSLSFDVDMLKPFSISISHYENPNLFFAQLNTEFVEFDVFYDDFQKSCEMADPVAVGDLKSALARSTLSNLAVAAKFAEDNSWYRARVVVNDALIEALQNDNTPSVLVEFIDYGNRQVTDFKDCVFLSKQFADMKPCAVKCDGVAYLDTVLNLHKIRQSAITNMLLYGFAEEKGGEEAEYNKITFDPVYFIGKLN